MQVRIKGAPTKKTFEHLFFLQDFENVPGWPPGLPSFSYWMAQLFSKILMFESLNWFHAEQLFVIISRLRNVQLYQPVLCSVLSDFQSGPAAAAATTAAAAADGFADFQTAAPAPPINDKLNVLKALVSDKSLYTAKPKEEGSKEQKDEKEEEEWADFAGTTAQSEDSFTAFKSTNSEQSSSFSGDANKDERVLSWGGEKDRSRASGVESADSNAGGWADFSSGPAPTAQPGPVTGTSNSTTTNTSIDWAAAIIKPPAPSNNDPDDDTDFASFQSSTPGPECASPKPSAKSPATKPRDLNPRDGSARPGKRYDYFGRSVASGGGLGVAALDTAPPDFPPDDDDDDDNDDFDKFGTFQVGDFLFSI